MTTAQLSPMTRITRRWGPRWRPAATRTPAGAPAAQADHELVVLSRHRTAAGVVTYTRCTCGELQIWLTEAGSPADTLITSIRWPEQPPTRHQNQALTNGVSRAGP